jgi:transcriptional regulator with XRE-family HTH domain
MENSSPMKIDAASVRKLREAKSWSQDHLAEVAGLSLRTVQRVEADGSASPETKMAVAAAFGVEPAELSVRIASVAAVPRNFRRGIWLGNFSVGVGAVSACLGVLSEHASGAETGFAFGLIGLFSGICFGAIGWFGWRYSRSEQRVA